MNKVKSFRPLTIVLTGAGGPAVPGMIDVLRQTLPAARLIAVDMDANAIGFHLAELGVVLPAGNSPYFISQMKNLCISEKVDVVVSVVDEELESLFELESIGVKVIQPQKSFVCLCLDKLVLMHQLKEHGLPAPQTELASEVDLKNLIYPLIVKPRVGRGSRGVFVATNETELISGLSASSYTPEQLLVQQLISGPEFTVSVVVWRDGEVQAVVPKEIISKRGVTKAAVTRRNLEIDIYCRDIQRCLKANGPFNVQLCLDSKTGIPYAFEINPRFSTSITLTMAAGVNELSGLIVQAVEGRESWTFAPWQEGQVLMRRTLDLFCAEDVYRNRPIQNRV